MTRRFFFFTFLPRALRTAEPGGIGLYQGRWSVPWFETDGSGGWLASTLAWLVVMRSFQDWTE